jgi:hypothetical protein
MPENRDSSHTAGLWSFSFDRFASETMTIEKNHQASSKPSVVTEKERRAKKVTK